MREGNDYLGGLRLSKIFWGWKVKINGGEIIKEGAITKRRNIGIWTQMAKGSSGMNGRT